jgi:hypothetical protein
MFSEFFALINSFLKSKAKKAKQKLGINKFKEFNGFAFI